MRTKTTLLCAAALAAGVVSSMAQSNVYSLNIVGYANVPINLGNNLIANPFNFDGVNSASNVLSCIAPLNSGGAVANTLDYFYLYTWNHTSGRFATVYYEDDYSPAGWTTDGSGNTPATPPLLGPGVAFIIDNSYQNATNTFVGSVVPQYGATFTNDLPLGNSYVGSAFPVSGALTNAVFQFPVAPLNSGGAIANTLDYFYLYTFNNVSGRYTSVYYEDDYTPTGWTTDGSGNTPAAPPTISIGQGFVIDNSYQDAPWLQTNTVP